METETITAAELAAEALPLEPSARGEANAAPQAAITSPAPAETDSLGRTFDAIKFAPKKDSAGRWVNKNAGRKPKSPTAAELSGKSFVAADAPPADAPPGAADRFDLAAEMYCRAGYSVLDGLFSANGEWLPESDGEHVALRGSLATYLRYKGSDDLPPGFALSLALATYASKRMSRPRTMTRLRLFVYWLRSWWHTFRTGQRLADLPPPAPPAPASESSPLPPQRNLPAKDSAQEPNLTF